MDDLKALAAKIIVEAVLTLCGAVIMYYTAIVRAKTREVARNEKLRAELEERARQIKAAQEESYNRVVGQLNASLETFRNEFARERLARQDSEVKVKTLLEQKAQQDTVIADLQKTAKVTAASVRRLESANAGLLKQVKDLKGEQDTLRQYTQRIEGERDGALKLLDERNGELKEAQLTIERIEQLLQDQTRELVEVRERLVKLEHPTGVLNPAVVHAPDAPTE